MRILLAVDDSNCSEAAITAVLNQAHRSNLEVLVLHIVDSCQLTPLSLMFGQGPSMGQSLNSLRKQWHERANALVTQTAERLAAAGIKAGTQVREGEPKTLIVEEASQWHADMIVLGSHGLQGAKRFLLGSVSNTVARHAPCSTWIVRPGSDGEMLVPSFDGSKDLHQSP